MLAKNPLITTALFFLLLTSGGCAFLMEGAEPSVAPSSVKKPTDLYNQALEKYQAGNYAEARQMFHEFIGQYPDSMLFKIALYYLGHCHQMLNETKEAEVLFSRVVDTYGEDDFWGAQAMKRLKQIREDRNSEEVPGVEP